MGTKAEPGEFDCHAAAAPDEPTFTLRANDPIAPEVVRFWLSRYLETKTADRSLSVDDMQRCVDKAMQAEKVAQAMMKWKIKQEALEAMEAEHPDADPDDGAPAAISSAELIERTDTPEIRGAVDPQGGGRHT